MIPAGEEEEEEEEEDSAAPWKVRTSPVTPGRGEQSERHVSLV